MASCRGVVLFGYLVGGVDDVVVGSGVGAFVGHGGALVEVGVFVVSGVCGVAVGVFFPFFFRVVAGVVFVAAVRVGFEVDVVVGAVGWVSDIVFCLIAVVVGVVDGGD